MPEQKQRPAENRAPMQFVLAWRPPKIVGFSLIIQEKTSVTILLTNKLVIMINIYTFIYTYSNTIEVVCPSDNTKS